MITGNEVAMSMGKLGLVFLIFTFGLGVLSFICGCILRNEERKFVTKLFGVFVAVSSFLLMGIDIAGLYFLAVTLGL